MNICKMFQNQILKVENTSLLLATGICQAPSRPFHILENINRNTNNSFQQQIFLFSKSVQFSLFLEIGIFKPISYLKEFANV